MENSNRKIAFRAWDKDQKLMLKYEPHGQQIYIKFNGETVDIDRDGDEMEIKGLELMQFTGLKDRNGVEIYEGDFVSNGKNTWQVEFMGGSFWLSKKHDILGSESTPMYRALLPSKFMNLDYPDGEIGTVEVVGNIYENPELIK